MTTDQDKLFEEIRSLLQKKNGIQAKMIARQLDTTKREVFFVLKGTKYQEHFRRDILFRWYLTAHGLNSLQEKNTNKEQDNIINASEIVPKNRSAVNHDNRNQENEKCNQRKYNNYVLKVGQKLRVKQRPNEWVKIKSFGNNTIIVEYFNRKTLDVVEVERPLGCVGKTLIVDKILETQPQENPTINGPGFIPGVYSPSRSPFDEKKRRKYEGTGNE